MAKLSPKLNSAKFTQDWLKWCLILLLVVMPFHAFLSIVLGHFIGHQAAWQSWKEIVILSMVLAGGWALVFGDAQLPRRSVQNFAAVSIIVLGLVLTLLGGVSLVPAAFGVKVTLLPLLVFLVAQLVSSVDDKLVVKLVLWPSYVVAGLALVQEFMLPTSWLGRVGYNSSTILPVQLVDPAVHNLRAFSTLGGPNQLGAYLILPAALGLVMAWRRKNALYALGSALTAAGVVVSFSRSAWLGLATAVLLAVFLLASKVVRIFLAAGVAVFVFGFILLSSYLPHLLGGTTAQYYLLHGSYNLGVVEGSDYGRSAAQAKGLKIVQDNPWGKGLGSAGPASFRSSAPIITENWYLQIGIEMGVLGVLLFMTFWGSSFWSLARASTDLAVALAASIVGLSVAAMFLHIWADSTLSICLFGLVGLELGSLSRARAKKGLS